MHISFVRECAYKLVVTVCALDNTPLSFASLAFVFREIGHYTHFMDTCLAINLMYVWSNYTFSVSVHNIMVTLLNYAPEKNAPLLFPTF